MFLLAGGAVPRAAVLQLTGLGIAQMAHKSTLWFQKGRQERRPNYRCNAPLTLVFSFSFVSADWNYSRHGGWAAKSPASA